MSDVWQGPGWWLASDGKWYPADAEPGAVYEGDLPNTDAPNPIADESSALAGATANPAAAAVPVDPTAAIETPEPVRPDEVWAADPSPFEETASPFNETTTPSFGDAPAMPAPVVESAKVGGWQAIDDTEVPIPDPFANEPDPVAAAVDVAGSEPVVDDGWTSAYEERHGPDDEPALGTIGTPVMPVVDDFVPDAPIPNFAAAVPDVAVPDMAVPNVAVPDMAAPDMTVPDMAVPNVAVPDMAVPDMAVPDMAAPDMAVPDVAVPDMTVPDMAVPEGFIPDVSAPDLSIPDVGIPDVGIPDVGIPDVGIPDVSAPIPDGFIPDVSAPDVTVPNITVPDVAVPDVTVPDLAVPEVSAPSFGAPDMTVPNVGIPEAVAGVAAGAVPLDNDITVPRGASAPIEREDAWRKPLTPEATAPRATAPTPPGRPDVVDLAIPEETGYQPVEPKGRPWRFIGGILLALVALAAIAWLISTLFAGNDTGTATGDTTTSSIAPAQTDSTEGDTETSSAPATTEETQTPTTEGATSVFSLRAGDCIVGDIGAGQVTKVEKVDCELEHQFEVYREALIDSSITTFDEEAISAYAEEVCRTSLAAYIPPDDERGLKFKFLQPTEDSWNQEEDPDRVITCLLFDDDAPLIGRAA